MNLYSPEDLRLRIARRAQDLRLARGRSQSDIAKAAGLSLSTLKRFERTGQASFTAVVRIAFALAAEDGVAQLFPPQDPRSIDDVLRSQRKRMRARSIV